MHRRARLALFTLTLAPGAWAMDSSPQSVTVLGTINPLLASGSAALEAGRYQEGIRLSLAGLEDVASARDQVAGYVALRRWDDALPHCNRSLDLDRGNWRAFNNRAAETRDRRRRPVRA